jgi:valyl-tRNA synthetase
MRMLHPFIPFITEEIAAKIPANGETIINGPFPAVDEGLLDADAEREMGTLMGLISAVRNIRAEMNLPPGKPLDVVVFPSSETERALVNESSNMVRFLGKVKDLTLHVPGSSDEPPRMSATSVVGEMRIFVPLEGVVDPDAEIARLEKELAKIRKEFDAVQKKLSNEDFLSKAKPEAIQKQRDRQAELASKLSGLGEGLDKMRGLKSA